MDTEVGLGLLADFTRLQEQIDNLKAGADSPDDVATGERALMVDVAAPMCCFGVLWVIDQLDDVTLIIPIQLPCLVMGDFSDTQQRTRMISAEQYCLIVISTCISSLLRRGPSKPNGPTGIACHHNRCQRPA